MGNGQLGSGAIWRHYMFWLGCLAVFAAVFGQFFLALEFTDDIWKAAIDRLLAIAVVALFLERAIEVYIVGWRRLGEQALRNRLAAYAEDYPDDRRGQRDLEWDLTHYRLETQRLTFIIALVFGVLIAVTGLRVLDGLVTISPGLRANPTWHTNTWYTVDILLSGGVIGGGAAGIQQLIATLTGTLRPDGKDGAARREPERPTRPERRRTDEGEAGRRPTPPQAPAE